MEGFFGAVLGAIMLRIAIANPAKSQMRERLLSKECVSVFSCVNVEKFFGLEVVETAKLSKSVAFGSEVQKRSTSEPIGE